MSDPVKKEAEEVRVPFIIDTRDQAATPFSRRAPLIMADQVVRRHIERPSGTLSAVIPPSETISTQPVDRNRTLVLALDLSIQPGASAEEAAWKTKIWNIIRSYRAQGLEMTLLPDEVDELVFKRAVWRKATHESAIENLGREVEQQLHGL